MRMTKKLVSLLTILFVCFKFGEPAQVMMSIYGDKSFLFESKALKITDVVGFVYEDADGGFDLVNCSATTDKTYFNLKTDCTVVPAAAVAVITADSTLDEGKAAAAKIETETDFPETSANTNMMVATPSTEPAIVIGTTTLLAGSATLVTIAPAVPTSAASSVVALDAQSKFLCNYLDATISGELFAVDEASDGTTFGQVKAVTSKTYLSIMKCAAAVQDTAPTKIAVATFILIVTDTKDLGGTFNSLSFPSVVLFPQSTTQPANGTTVVGYINGKDNCPTSNNVTFGDSLTTSTAPCKGTISIGALGNYSFSYNGTAHYLLATDASGATTCPATTTTTCEDFAFNFKYSNTFIGMLLIFILKMLQSY